jgi:hypothetical protein
MATLPGTGTAGLSYSVPSGLVYRRITRIGRPMRLNVMRNSGLVAPHVTRELAVGTACKRDLGPVADFKGSGAHARR